MRGFQVSTRHTKHKRIVRVVIHPDKETMIKAVKRYDSETNRRYKGNYESAAAWTLMYWMAKKDKLGRTIRGPAEATIMMYLPVITAEIVVHEITHAALHFYQADFKRSLGKVKDEEFICYLVGDLFAKINRKLHDYGVWKT